MFLCSSPLYPTYPEYRRLFGVSHVVVDVTHLVVQRGEGLLALVTAHLDPQEKKVG